MRKTRSEELKAVLGKTEFADDLIKPETKTPQQIIQEGFESAKAKCPKGFVNEMIKINSKESKLSRAHRDSVVRTIKNLTTDAEFEILKMLKWEN